MADYRIKNTEQDSPGYLMEKFDNTGRVVMSVHTDTIAHRTYYELQSNDKDSYEHLLKPSCSFPLIHADTKLDTDTKVIIFPIILPIGFVESVSFVTGDFSKIRSFELACYGNDKNVITGATQWFYCSSEIMEYDGKCSYKLRSGEKQSIVPKNFNYVAIRMKFKEDGDIIAKNVDDTISESLMNTSCELETDFSISTMKTITEDLTKGKVSVIPYVQFNVLKAT